MLETYIILIKFVDSWLHLGHIIGDTRGDKSDVSQRPFKFIVQVNNVLGWFSKAKAVISKLDCCAPCPSVRPVSDFLEMGKTESF